jgi:hypothetical protein
MCLHPLVVRAEMRIGFLGNVLILVRVSIVT